MNELLKLLERDLAVLVHIRYIKHVGCEFTRSLAAQCSSHLCAIRTSLEYSQEVSSKGTKLGTCQVTVAIEIVRVEGSFNLGVAVRISERGF